MIGKTFLHYRVLEKLGAGGMGVVYKAEDTRLGRVVALKTLPPEILAQAEERARLLREARAAAALNHPNACMVHEIHDDHETPFLVMEYIAGRNLRDLLKDGPLEPEKALDILNQAASALAAAHEQGVVHRDLKPENIMITPEGRVKVLDFGLARVAGASRLTREGETPGTTPYMAPELFQGKEANPRSDVWSLGVVAYEMLTGKPPFGGDYAAAVMYAVLNEEPPPLPPGNSDATRALTAFVQQALRKDPEERRNTPEILDVPRRDASSRARRTRTIRRFSFAGLILALLAALAWFSLRALRPAPATPGNAIAVTYFENATGNPALDMMARNLAPLLITNLSRYPNLDVICSQRLFDVRKALGHADDPSISRETATRIARSATAAYMIAGRIFQAGERLRVTVEISDVSGGRNLGSDTVEGGGERDTFLVVDALTARAASILGGRLPEASGSDPRVADVTTSHLEAYKHYRAGMEQVFRFNMAPACESFERALKTDDRFAMAYGMLAWSRHSIQLNNPLNTLASGLGLMNQAQRLAHRCTPRERMWINAFQALFQRDYPTFISRSREYLGSYPRDKMMASELGVAFYWYAGRPEPAEKYLLQAVNLDPNYAMGHNNLAYIYNQTGKLDQAVFHLRRYLALYPEEINPHHSAYEIHITAGRYNDAEAVCRDALQRHPHWHLLSTLLGDLTLLRGQIAAARGHFESNRESNPERFGIEGLHMAATWITEGRFVGAAREMGRVREWYEQKNYRKSLLQAGLFQARLEMLAGNPEAALRVLDAVDRDSEAAYPESFNPARVLTTYLRGRMAVMENNEKAVLNAANRISTLVREEQMHALYKGYRHLLLAEWSNRLNDPDAAQSHLEQTPNGMRLFYPPSYRIQTRIHILSGDFASALAECTGFRNAVMTMNPNYGGDLMEFFYERARLPFVMGTIHEAAGNREAALKNYRRAAAQWKNADPAHKEARLARQYLARLEAGTGR